MERHRRGHKRLVADERGQATLEYALVTAALMAVVVGLWAVRQLFFGGLAADHALAAASHHVDGAWGWVCDVLAF